MVSIAHAVLMVGALGAPFFVYKYVAFGRFVGQAFDVIIVLQPKTCEKALGREYREYLGRNADRESSTIDKELVG